MTAVWTGLRAAAGDQSGVLEAASRTATTAGVAAAGWPINALGFLYDTGYQAVPPDR